MAANELYRRSKIGEALTDTLDELINSNLIDPKLALTVVKQFDVAIAEALSTRVRTKLNIKGHVYIYRFCDDVWTFVLKDPSIRLDSADISGVERIKIIASNAAKKDEA